MFTVLAIILIIAALILVLIILAQNPKGGGLSATFGGSNQIIGARQTADFLEKATYYIAIGIAVVVILSNVFIPKDKIEEQRQSKLQEQFEELPIDLPTGGVADPNNTPSDEQ